MTTATTHYRREFEAIERGHKKAPGTWRMACVIREQAERLPQGGLYERLSALAGRLEGWADAGHEVTAEEASHVLEAALLILKAEGRL